MGLHRHWLFVAAAAVLLTLPGRATGADRLCDPAFEDCRAPLIALIDNETVGIDVAFWFMEDARYSAALERAKARNVKIRVIFDSEALPNEPVRQFVVDTLVHAGIPMREKVDSGINHWKLMIFAGQKVVQFSGANHTSEAFVYEVPYSAYVDEVIYFTDKTSLVNSFMTKYDDVWTSTNGMLANYANVTTITRAYPTTPIDPELNFAPFESFRDRSTATYRAENTRIDAIIYRITDRAHTDTLIENVQRGVGLRLITEPYQYRDESRLWHSWNVDRLYKAGLQNPIGGQPGIQVRHRLHTGLLHEKLSIMIGQGMSVFGSSNWTSASSEYQLEHNLFTHDPAFYTWSRNHFDRKWNNLGGAPETTAFVPLPPDKPSLLSPLHNETGQPTTVTLLWRAGPWAHRYDVFLGTDPANLVRIVNDEELGPYDISTTVTGLVSGTRYYWRVVSRTMADLTQTSDTFSFVTAGAAPGNVPPTVSLTSPTTGASFTAPAAIALTATAGDTDGTVARVDFLAGTTVVGSAVAAPYSFNWTNVPAGGYSISARVVDNLGATTTSPSATITVSSSPGGGVPAPWSHGDIGAVAQAGNASINSGAWTVTGSGADVWGTSDQFHFAYQPLTGDGTIIARVTSVQNVDQWTKAGVMLRQSLSPGSAHAFMLVTPEGSTKGLAFQRRTTTDGASTNTGGGDGAAPVWVRLTRSGNLITAYRSTDGVAWTTVGSDIIPMAATIYAGLAVNSHNAGALATATLDSVSVTPAGGPPPNASPTVSLTAPSNGATFTAPAAMTLTADAFDSDGTIAKVDFYEGATLLGTDTSSPYSFAWSNVPNGTYSLTARATDNLGALATSAGVTIQVTTAAPPPLPAGWANQDIGGVAISGATSFASNTFTLSGSGADVWGTADEFHFAYRQLSGDGTIVARVASLQNVDQWTKAGVMLRQSLTPGSAHAFMLVTPAGSTKGMAFQRRTATDSSSTHTAGGDGAAPVWVRLTRSGDTITAYRSPDGVTWTAVGSDTIPMTATVYAGLAVNSHNAGAQATATFDNVSLTAAVAPAPNGSPTVGLTAPASGATFTAPAAVTLSANAFDSDGTVAKVDFYAGTTLLGTDTSSPYSFAWNDVPAGSYSLTAVATDNLGAQATSTAVSIQVTPAAPATLPAGWANQDIGAVAIAGSTSFAGGAFTVRGSGADIWGTADAFHFVYRTLTGDGSIVARVASLENIDQWTKAGVMIRASLAPGSRHAMMVVSPGKGLAFQRRTADDASSVHTAGPLVTAPVWVRLQRSGSLITASTSSDGVSWSVVGTETISLPDTIYVGLPLTSHNAGTAATAVIDSVTVAP